MTESRNGRRDGRLPPGHRCGVVILVLVGLVGGCAPPHLRPPPEMDGSTEPTPIAVAPRTESTITPMATAGAPNPIVASYEGREIRASELCGRFFLDYRKEAFAALSKMIGVEIVEKEARRIGLTLPEGWAREREQELRSQIAKEGILNYGVGTSPEDYVQRRFRQSLAEHLRHRKEVERQRWLFSRVIRYQALLTDRVELDMIVTKDEQVIREVDEKLRQGADFATLARRYSIHGSRRNGGRLPPLPREALNAGVAEQAFALAPGEASGILSLDDGQGNRQYEIVRVHRRLMGREVSYAAVSPEVEESLKRSPVDETEWTAWYLRLERLYKVKLASTL